MGFTGTLTGAGSLTYSRGAGDNKYNSNGKLIIGGDASGSVSYTHLDVYKRQGIFSCCFQSCLFYLLFRKLECRYSL